MEYARQFLYVYLYLVPFLSLFKHLPFLSFPFLVSSSFHRFSHFPSRVERGEEQSSIFENVSWLLEEGVVSHEQGDFLTI